MAAIRTLKRIWFAALLMLSSWAAAEDLASNYLLLEPGFTNVGEMDLQEAIWVGPVQFKATEKPLQVEGVRTSSPNLTVLDAPESIEAGVVCEVEVAFTPKALGLQTIKVNLETNGGRLQSIVRVLVVADDPLRALAMTWPVTVKPSNVVPADELLEDIRENPHDWTRILVDVRPKNRFEQGHAVGARSMFLHELRFREEWKQNRVYLIDDGVFEQSRLLEAKRLKEAGFTSVYWVDGGLPEWIRAGGEVSLPVSGNQSSVYGDEAWRVLKPLQLYYSAVRSDMRLLFMGSPEEQKRAELLFPDQKFYRWDAYENMDRLTEELSVSDPILLLGATDQGFYNLVSRFREAGYHRVYAIDGGLDAMVAYLESKRIKDADLRTYSVRAGARNPKGKLPPTLKRDANCLTCN